MLQNYDSSFAEHELDLINFGSYKTRNYKQKII